MSRKEVEKSQPLKVPQRSYTQKLLGPLNVTFESIGGGSKLGRTKEGGKEYLGGGYELKKKRKSLREMLMKKEKEEN